MVALNGIPKPNRRASLCGILKAFQTATGLGIRLVAPGDQQPLCACENRFCALLRNINDPSTPCAGTRPSGTNGDGVPVPIARCDAGLEHISLAVPGTKGPAAFVESGQVFVRPPQRDDFQRLRARFPAWERRDLLPLLEAAFFATPVLTRERLEAGTELLRQIIPAFAPLLVRSDLRCQSRSDPVETAKLFIHQNIEQTVGLAQLAAHVGVSPAYLCRVFKHRCGQSPGQYIAYLRVERAKQLLVRNGHRAVDAAYASGFQSVRQFNHVFKTRTGLTPSEYRRRLANSEKL